MHNFKDTDTGASNCCKSYLYTLFGCLCVFYIFSSVFQPTTAVAGRSESEQRCQDDRNPVQELQSAHIQLQIHTQVTNKIGKH